ncbi:diaminopimelate epimerase [Anaplasmataceae bacterium AB001_6]|nr:diaminopimelate epimerase [Anaplasmataceae bacterium AB001_6]
MDEFAIKAYRMHSTKNEFIILDCFVFTKNFIERNLSKIFYRIFELTKNNLCDQIIFFFRDNQNDCEMRIYNYNCSLAEACGNATVCVAYLLHKKLKKNRLSIRILDKLIFADINDDGSVSVNMGKVSYGWQNIPLSKEQDCLKIDSIDAFYTKKYGFPMAFNVGNPHLIFFIQSLDILNMTDAKNLEKDLLFPQGINISFVEKKDKEYFVRVWERGVGETQSCGSAACAIYFALCMKEFCQFGDDISINFQGGKVFLSYKNANVIFINYPILIDKYLISKFNFKYLY